jgi:7-cyano-7-deazaguanine synthase
MTSPHRVHDPWVHDPSVVLVSGGLDSAVTAAVAANSSDPAFLHVNYGQRTEKKELECFNAIARYFGVKKRLVVDISYLKGGHKLSQGYGRLGPH